MKTLRLSLPLLSLALLLALLPLRAQDPKPPQTWEEKKAARFKPVTSDDEAAILAALPAKPTATPQSPRKVLVFFFCEGFIHTSIPHGNFALQKMGEKSGAFTADLAEDYSVFDPSNLAQYDAIVFNNTTRLTFPHPAHRQAVLDFIASGKGIIGIHAASDNFANWPEALHMMGGIFHGHPWNAGGEWAFKLNDASHPLNAAFQGSGFWLKDEIYQYHPDSFAGEDHLRILVSLDMTKSRNIQVLLASKPDKPPLAASEAEAKARRVPVSWLRSFQGGRLFYSNLGHNESTYAHPAVLQHFLDGFQYALGDLSADATPTAQISGLQEALAPAE